MEKSLCFKRLLEMKGLLFKKLKWNYFFSFWLWVLQTFSTDRFKCIVGGKPIIDESLMR